MIPEPLFLFIAAVFLIGVGMAIQAGRQKLAEREARFWRVARDIREEPHL